MERLISLLGLFAMVFFAWLLSSDRRKISWRIVSGGMVLQFGLGLFVLRTKLGHAVFDSAGTVFRSLLDCVDKGSAEVFGPGFTEHFIAFKVLPTIIFFSALMSILYYLGIVQILVQAVAWIMQKTLGTSGAESLSAAANIFVGQTEAPLVIRPYIQAMTQSELMSVMVGGFATIAGGVLAAYIGMGIDASHLITASVISAPAALLIAKVLQPETEEPKTLGVVRVKVERTATNFLEAAGNGTIDGLKLALNVGAMLIAFIALVTVGNALLAWCCQSIHIEVWTLEQLIGVAFYPFAWLMGIPSQDCWIAGELLGTKMVLNEFVAYAELGEIISNASSTAETAAVEGVAAPERVTESVRQLGQRSITILTYALCGFANFSSIGIQLGGIGGIAPERKSDLARLGFRAMLGGTLAAFMTACVAGILL